LESIKPYFTSMHYITSMLGSWGSMQERVYTEYLKSIPWSG
jgi:hypothetical protein